MSNPGASTGGFNPEVDFLPSRSLTPVSSPRLGAVRERRGSFAETTIQDHPAALPPSAFVLNPDTRRDSRFSPYRTPPGSGPDVRWYRIVKQPRPPSSHSPLATRATSTGSPHLSDIDHSPRSKKVNTRAFYGHQNEGSPHRGAHMPRSQSHVVTDDSLTESGVSTKLNVEQQSSSPQVGPYVLSWSVGSHLGPESSLSDGGIDLADRESPAELELCELLADSVLSSTINDENCRAARS